MTERGYVCISQMPYHDVFLCYNTLDREGVDRVAGLLASKGIVVFQDTGMKAGVKWFETIETALMNSAAVTVFIGRHGLGRFQASLEGADQGVNVQNSDFALEADLKSEH